MFQEPSCPDGGGEARACLEDEEYFIVVCDFRNPLAQMEEEKREHVQKMKKMEAEMEQVFEMKVKEKKQKLKDSEADVSNKYVAHSTTYLCHEKGRRSLQSIRH